MSALRQVENVIFLFRFSDSGAEIDFCSNHLGNMSGVEEHSVCVNVLTNSRLYIRFFLSNVALLRDWMLNS